MTVKPITIKPQEVHIHADRRLAFEVLTSFGTAMRSGDGGSAEVLRDEGDRMLVRFNTPVKLLGLIKIWPTEEWVTPTEPEQIDFELVPGKGPLVGGLKLLTDRFTLHDASGCTVMRYESTFGIRWSWPGWLLGKLAIAPLIRSHMHHHLDDVKDTIEARAARSHVYQRVESCLEMQP